MSAAALLPEIDEPARTSTGDPVCSQPSLVYVFLKDGRCREGTWMGDVWWLRNGAVVRADQVQSWEPIPPMVVPAAFAELAG